MSEFNRAPREAESAGEYKNSPAEFHSADEERYYSENKIPENTAPRKKTKQKSALPQLLTSFAVVAAVAVAAASAGVFDVGAGNNSAVISSVNVTDTAVSYGVTVEEGDNLTVVLYNDFTRRETPLNTGENRGQFTELKPGVSYTLAVVAPSAFGSEKTVVKQSVTTELLPPPAPLSVWRGVTHNCTCNVDGMFHFTMDFDDPNGYYTDFSAVLEDAYGNKSQCIFSEDLHARQNIDVTLSAGLMGKTAKFTLSFVSADPNDTGKIMVYTADVKI